MRVQEGESGGGGEGEMLNASFQRHEANEFLGTVGNDA